MGVRAEEFAVDQIESKEAKEFLGAHAGEGFEGIVESDGRDPVFSGQFGIGKSAVHALEKHLQDAENRPFSFAEPG